MQNMLQGLHHLQASEQGSIGSEFACQILMAYLNHDNEAVADRYSDI